MPVTLRLGPRMEDSRVIIAYNHASRSGHKTAKQKSIKAILDALMLGFSARTSGPASIDATKPGADWPGGGSRPNGSPNPPKFDVR